MSTQELIAHVEDSIARALRHESYLDASVLEIKGFSTGVQRRLVSNLARLPKENPVYLEAGLFAGASFCAAINNNPTLTAIGIENWSQPFGQDNVEGLFSAAYEKNLGGRHVIIIHDDCFSPSAKKEIAMELPIDFYYFDAEHSFQSQAKALPHFIDCTADLFLFMVDDFSWEQVRAGTKAGFETLAGKISIEKEWVLSDGRPDGPTWHNDVALYVVSKI